MQSLLSELNSTQLIRPKAIKIAVMAVLGFLLVWLGLISVLLVWTGIWLGIASKSLSQLSTDQDLATRISSAQQALGYAARGIGFANNLSLKLIPDLKAAEATLNTAHSGIHLANDLEALQSQFSSGSKLSVTTFKNGFSAFQADLAELTSVLQEIEGKPLSLIAHLLTAEHLNSLQTITQTSAILEEILNHPGTYIVLFQNSDELRATGGFLGSYAKITYDGEFIHPPTIHDIYEPAGQFTGFIEAPPGAHEYLSGGKGLALPDANWWPDFPTSAQTILRFFSLGEEQDIVGLAAINSTLITDILSVTGPIYLPDYDQMVSSYTFTELARADRENFFPGSKQKVSFLSHFMTQLQLKTAELSPQQLSELLSLIPQITQRKQIMLYHEQPAVQEKIIEANLAQSLQIPDNTELYIFPVESNVGINKANKAVARTFELLIKPSQSTLKLHFSNENIPGSAPVNTNPSLATANHLHYVNFQRVLVSPQLAIKSVKQDGRELEIIQNDLSEDQTFREIGFLAIIYEGTTSTIEIDFEHLVPLSSTTQVTVPFQPGTLPTTIILQTPQEYLKKTFDSDLTVQLPV